MEQKDRGTREKEEQKRQRCARDREKQQRGRGVREKDSNEERVKQEHQKVRENKKLERQRST